MAGYNRTRHVEQLLENTASSPPSFTVHLHPEYWVLNQGSKFLYHNPIASLLDDIRLHRIPVDFLELFDSARVPFYDGCMVVELLDYRPPRSKEPALKTPDKTRVVLHPNSETLWADICSMNRRNGKKWSDNDTLEVEAQLLLATAPPLCLNPDPHLTRIVNQVLRVSTPNMPASLKRKASVMEPEEDGPDKVRRDRIIGFMAPRDNRLHAPRYSLLDTISAFRQGKIDGGGMNSVPMPGNQYMSTPTQPPQPAQPTQAVPQQSPVAPPTPAPTSASVHSPVETADKKPILAIKPKVETPVSFNMAFQRTNGSHTPVPPQPTHQFVNQHPPPALPANVAVLQPQVYANVHAATEAAKRAPTPAQMHSSQQSYQYQQYQLQQQHQQQQAQQQAPQPPPQAQQPPQAQPPPQARPPSQPQLQQQQHPQPTQQQGIQQLQVQAQQRYTQSPKPASQASSGHAQVTPQGYPGVPSAFQPPVPNNQFLRQPPMGMRSGQKPQMPPQQHQQQQSQQQSQIGGSLSLPQNTNVAPNPAQQAQAQVQMLYNQQMQQSQQHMLHQQQQQRLALAQAQKNGRMTPQAALVVQNQQAMGQAQVGQVQNAATTPSPVRGSPMVGHQQLTAASVARSSPMLTKSQLPPQQLAAQGMQIHQQHRVPFPPSYNPSALRPVVHNSPQAQAHMVAAMNSSQGASPAQSSPKNHATPSPAAARPITPAINAIGDVKQQMSQPLRRPTPLQQQQMIHSQQMQQQQTGTPHLQPQIPQRSPMPPHASPRQQAQRSPAQQQQQVQQPQQQQVQAAGQMQAQGQTPQAQIQQQMALYPTGYPFQYQVPAYWQMRGMTAPTGTAPQAQAQAQAQMQQMAANQAMLAAGQGQQQQSQQQAQAQPQQQQQQAGQQGQLSIEQQHAMLMNGQQSTAMMMPKVQMHQQQQGGQPQKPLGRTPKIPPVGVGSPFQLQGYLPNPTTAQVPVQGGQGKGKAGAKKGGKKAVGQR